MKKHVYRAWFESSLRLKNILAVFLLVFILSPEHSFAHPHVFIEQKTALVFDEKGVAGFRINWTFDDMFSVMICDDFDSDHNGHLDEKEVAVIREKAFGYIAAYNYYIHIKIDGRPFPVKFIQEFNARLDKNKLVYDFFIPCHVTAVDTPKSIVISPYDPEYYSDIYFPDSRHLSLEDAALFAVETKIERDRSTWIYYETVNPLGIFFTFKKNQ